MRIFLDEWLQCIEDSSEPPKVMSPVMRNDKPIEDFAKHLISEEMARSSQLIARSSPIRKNPNFYLKMRILTREGGGNCLSLFRHRYSWCIS